MNRGKTFLNQLFIGLTMFGTLVGAGFASGKEIWFYFARFGNIAYFMIILTGLLFFLLSYVFFSFGKKYQIQTVQDCNSVILGRFAIISEMVLIFSNLILLASMFAGADSLFNIIIPNMPYRLAGVITSLITFVVVCFGFKGITKTNMLIVPLLLLVVFVVLVAGLAGGGSAIMAQPLGFSSFFKSMFYALLFVGSNMFFSGFIFSRMGKDYSKKEILGGSLIGSVFLTLGLLGITMALFASPSLVNSDMPIVAISASINTTFGYAVLAIVWLGLITTAFALLYTISNWLKAYFGKTILTTLLATIIAFFMSGIGFSSFIEIVYPMMGVLGFVFVLLIKISEKRSKNIKNFKKEAKKRQISDKIV